MEPVYQGDVLSGAGIVGLVLMVLVITTAVSLLPTIFYLLTMQKAFNRCDPRTRSMTPGFVWLLFIPVFGIVWHFYIVTGVTDSLAREYAARGETIEIRSARSMGLAMCILNVCTVIPFLGAFSALAGFVCWILFWIRIAEYSSRLSYAAQTPPGPPVNPAGDPS